MQKKPQEMTVKQLASKFHEEKNLLSREEHFSFSSEYKLLKKMMLHAQFKSCQHLQFRSGKNF